MILSCCSCLQMLWGECSQWPSVWGHYSEHCCCIIIILIIMTCNNNFHKIMLARGPAAAAAENKLNYFCVDHCVKSQW